MSLLMELWEFSRHRDYKYHAPNGAICIAQLNLAAPPSCLNCPFVPRNLWVLITVRFCVLSLPTAHC